MGLENKGTARSKPEYIKNRRRIITFLHIITIIAILYAAMASYSSKRAQYDYEDCVEDADLAQQNAEKAIYREMVERLQDLHFITMNVFIIMKCKETGGGQCPPSTETSAKIFENKDVFAKMIDAHNAQLEAESVSRKCNLQRTLWREWDLVALIIGLLVQALAIFLEWAARKT